MRKMWDMCTVREELAAKNTQVDSSAVKSCSLTIELETNTNVEKNIVFMVTLFELIGIRLRNVVLVSQFCIVDNYISYSYWFCRGKSFCREDNERR